jgi:hypothetical protein
LFFYFFLKLLSAQISKNLPRSLLTVENDSCVNQPGLLAKRGIEAVLLQKSRAPICIRGTPEASVSRLIGDRL